MYYVEIDARISSEQLRWIERFAESNGMTVDEALDFAIVVLQNTYGIK